MFTFANFQKTLASYKYKAQLLLTELTNLIKNTHVKYAQNFFESKNKIEIFFNYYVSTKNSLVVVLLGI
jgi:hypothetical protein